ncbi:NADAR domain-containing protein [Puia sp. P3]|uniref:NADAR domain-containing protein n=1 Tax=Puia sp. P3 TaxID=3423952 RepID=UPI003D67C989
MADPKISRRRGNSLPFFRGHQPAEDGEVSTSCFSQFWVAPFRVDGVVYPTAEHWMMAGKAKLFGDEVALKVILGDE